MTTNVSVVTEELLLLPWADHASLLEGATEGLQVAIYDGRDEPPASVLDLVTFYVPPYMGTAEALGLMRRMPSLRIVQTLTAGVDSVWADLPDGVALYNAAGVHDASTAELAVGLAIASLRHLDDFSRAQALGEWRHGRFDSLADKCVMILGYGHVGEAVDRRLAGFDVDVVRVARTARTSREGDVVHGVDELPALLPSVDVVIVIVPQTPETIGMVDAEFLSRMRPGALLVNVARGPVVVTDDLVAALREGRVRAALDVTDPEPLPPGHPLWSAPGVLISPHVGGNTSAFLPRAHRLVAAQVRRWCSGEALENAMDRPRP